MALSAFTKILSEEEHTKKLMEYLFGPDPQRHLSVSLLLGTIASLSGTEAIYLICGDDTVVLENDPRFPPDPRGMGTWVDRVHRFMLNFDPFVPYEPGRKPDIPI